MTSASEPRNRVMKALTSGRVHQGGQFGHIVGVDARGKDLVEVRFCLMDRRYRLSVGSSAASR